MTCLGVLERGERDKNNETGLKERSVIKISTTVLHSRAARSLIYLPLDIDRDSVTKSCKLFMDGSLDILPGSTIKPSTLNLLSLCKCDSNPDIICLTLRSKFKV